MTDQVLRSLIVVLILAAPAFYVSKQISSGIFSAHEFSVVRTVWFAVTLAGFLASNLLVFCAILVVICIYAHLSGVAKPFLFIIILFAVPLVRVDVSSLSGTRLIEMDHPRVMAIFLFLPILWKAGFFRRRQDGFAVPDYLILAYVMISAGLEARDAEITQFMRLVTTAIIDILLPYYAFSRLVTSPSDIRKVLISFAIAALPLALVAAFEFAKSWRLYTVIANQWGSVNTHSYLLRDGMLRGSATAFNAIVLGMVLFVAIGCLISVRQSVLSRKFNLIAFGILGIGLVATLSRGPWVGAATMIVIAIATGPNGASNLAKLGVAGAVGVFVLLLSPFGQRLIDFLPFVGTVEVRNINYRSDLFVNSLAVIDRNFWWGSVDYRQQPEFDQLRQHGSTFIDIVNHYVKIALDGGAVGLGLFVSFFSVIVLGLWRVKSLYPDQNSEIRVLAIGIMSTLIAILVLIGTVSAVDYVPFIFWTFGGLSVAMVRVAARQKAAADRALSGVPTAQPARLNFGTHSLKPD